MNKKKSSNKKAIGYINIWKFKIRKSTFLIITAFLSSILLIVSTYAWFFASLDVRISSLNMTVSDESGLFISLDGINWSSSVSVSKDILFKDLNRRYIGYEISKEYCQIAKKRIAIETSTLF